MRLRQPCRDPRRVLRRAIGGILFLLPFLLHSSTCNAGFLIERELRAADGPCYLIVPAVDSLAGITGCDGRALRSGEEFELRGDTVCLKVDPDACERYTLILHRDYPLLRRTFSLRPYATAGDRPLAGEPPDVEKKETRRSRSNLQITGAKSFSADLSDRGGTNLSQGLTMTVTGDLGKDVMVRGSFSDRGLRETRLVTRRFSELESMYLEVASPRLRSVFGSFTLLRDRFRFMSLERKVQGLQVAYSGRQSLTEVAAAVPQGRFGSHEFATEDGNYGPYRLRGENGEVGIAVVENSDQVWLNGVKLSRGRDQDYYIDYLQGELFFTGRRIIDNGDRVRVEYDFQKLEYRKTLLTGAAVVQSSDSSRSIAIGYTGQLSARNDPEDFVLSDSDLSVLSAAGDDQEAAAVSGANLVGAGLGDYQVESDSSGVRYVYVGEGNGDYRVVFSEVEVGDYSYLGGGRYQYVGSGLGRFLPVRRLALPESAQLAAVKSEANLGRAVKIAGELAYSNYDRNRFSSRDDADNSQIAAFAALRGGLPGSTHSAGLTAEYLPAQFYRLSRLDDVDAAYLWQRRFRLPKDRRRLDGYYEVAADSGLKAQLSGGITREGSEFRAENAGLESRAQIGASTDLRLSADWARSNEAGIERRLFRLQPNVSQRFGALALEGGGEYDQLRTDGGTAPAGTSSKRELVLGAGYQGVKASVRLRENWENQASWRLVDSKRSAVFQIVRTLGIGRKISATATANRFRNAVGRDDYQTGVVDLLAPRILRAIDLTANYRLNRRGVSQTNETYIKVDAGEGDYVLIDSVYVAQSRGDYIRVTENVGASLQSSDGEKRISIEGRLEDIWRIPPTSGITVRYEVNLREIGAALDRAPWEWLAPQKRLYSTTARFAERDDVYRVQRYDRALRLRTEVEYRRTSDDNLLDITYPSRRRGEEFKLGINQGLRTRDVVTASVGGRNRSWREPNRLNLFLRERKLELGGVRYEGIFEFALNGSCARERSDSLGLESVSIKVSPGINCNLGSKGRLEFASFVLSISESFNRPILLQMAEGFPVGTHAGGRLRVELNLTRSFVFKVLANCEIREGEADRYFLRSELISKFE